MELTELKYQTAQLIDDVLQQAAVKKGQIFVLGLSSSEVNGGVIGHKSSAEIGQVIVKVIYDKLSEIGAFLAVQGCEHLNRALLDRKSTRLNSSHHSTSYAVFCLKKKKTMISAAASAPAVALMSAITTCAPSA